MNTPAAARIARSWTISGIAILAVGALSVWAAPERTGGSPHRVTASTAGIPSRSFEFHYRVDVPVPPAGSHRLRIWVPLPYENSRSQSVSDLRINAPVHYEIGRDRRFNDRYAYFDLNSAQIQEPFRIELVFHVKRLEDRVPLHPLPDAPARTEAVDSFLQPDRLVPIDGEIGDLSREQTQGTSQPLEKARRIYDYVIASMHYDHAGTGWGRGDAVWACNAKHGNCTDFHSLFIGMARAAGIPARFEIGFPLPTSATSGTIPGYHCWAEFWADGIGWIPIDASEAWQDPTKKDYFFGAIDANRVMFSLGRDLEVSPKPAAGSLNYLVYPYAELDGKPSTDLKHEFSFRDDMVSGQMSAGNAQ
ncbi:MAG TPA: transglutaminase domain-containing protein [Candidatus Acidoferrum sp.]|nr:transglutaminase domain-containing protein [Candidatus Acidoferrum sp.]